MKGYVLISAATTILAMQAHTGTMGELVSNQTWLGTISAGPAWASAGESQTFYLAPEIEKTYSAHKASNAIGEGELFVGIQKPLPYQLQGQLGFAVATTSNANLQGEIWDDANPEFNNFLYQYRVRNTRIALKGKVLSDNSLSLINRYVELIPWVSGSVAVGFNRAHYFNNTPTIFEAVPNPNFTDKMQAAFSYTVGAGLQKTLTQHWQCGVGYEFADWGKSELGRAHGQTLNTGLGLNHLYTNGVMFNLTFVA